jgi:hypothetical protein
VSLLWDMYSELNFGMRAEKEENVESWNNIVKPAHAVTCI